jgi:Sporulation and spore germination/Immunoglobulin-like domain of bacterial spore germination
VRRLALALVLLTLAGCADGDDDAAPPTLGTDRTATEAAPTTSPATTVTPTTGEALVLRLYFVRNGRIAATSRDLEPTRAVAAAAVRELLDGPTATEENARVDTAIPTATRLRGVSINGDVATVDLSREFESGGGSLSMQLRVAQVVYTLTQFRNVKRVLFRIDGQPADAIGGEGVLVSPPVGRGNFEDVTPQILVESPTPGAEVSSPLRVTGTANTFEATLFLKVVDSSGKTLVDRFFTATSGSGTRGTFDATLRFEIDRPGIATLIAYERSAENGEPIHVVRIPIRLEEAR